MLVGKLALNRPVRIVRVVHTRAKVSVVKLLVLMTKTERMPGLLTYDHLSPGGRVVGGGAAGPPEGGGPGPAVVAVGGVTATNLSRWRRALLTGAVIIIPSLDYG